MKILCIINDVYSPPGTVGDQILDAGFELELINPHKGDLLPSKLPGEVGGLIVLGGIMHAYEDDKYPHLAGIARLMAEAHAIAVPVLGICLGAQLLARALGHDRVTMPAYEFGFVQLEMTDAGRQDALLKGLDLPPIMQGHEDNFELPVGSELLLRGGFCNNQAYRVGRASYGFQCHFEVTEAMIQEWVRQARDYLASRLGDDPQGFLDTVVADAPLKSPAAGDFARQVTLRWLTLVQERAVLENA